MVLIETLPAIHTSAWLADSADVMGSVFVGADSSLWYQTVVRGDIEPIVIGKRTNIQDHSTLHTSKGAPCTVGNGVTVGHRVILHGGTIGDGCLVGMGSIVMDHAVLEAGCFLAAGSLVPEGKILRGGFLYAGSPAKERRELTPEEKAFLIKSADNYVNLAKSHQAALSND